MNLSRKILFRLLGKVTAKSRAKATVLFLWIATVGDFL